MKKLVFAIAMVAAGVASAVSFSYQGALRTAEGGPIPADESNKTITFRLYDTPAGEGALWGRTLAVHLNDNGLFNVELYDKAGSDVAGVKTNDLAWVLSQYSGNGQDLYIGLDVLGSSGEIRPRQKLLNVPTAAFAADVSQARRDFTVEGIATFRGEVKAKGNLTVTGAATAESGLTVSGGDLTITRGTLSVPNGGVIPRGGIIMWSGTATEIPAGWALCDGGNGTPDLRGRFIVGAGGNYTPKATGGEENVTLNETQMPSHVHTFEANMKTIGTAGRADQGNWDGYWNYGLFVRWVGQADGVNDAWNGSRLKRPDVKYGDDIVTFPKVSSQGGGQPHNNMPPYYALCFIMKL